MIIVDDDSGLDEKDPLLGISSREPSPQPSPPDQPLPVVTRDPGNAWLASHLRRFRAWKLFRRVRKRLLWMVLVLLVLVAISLSLAGKFGHIARFLFRPRSPKRFFPWANHRPRYPSSGMPEIPLPNTPFPPVNSGSRMPPLSPPRIPPSRYPPQWRSACNQSEQLFSSANVPFRYALNDTLSISVEVLGPINGTLRVEVGEGLLPEVAMLADGEPTGINACLLASDAGHQGIGVWVPPFTLVEDGTGLMKGKSKNCSSYSDTQLDGFTNRTVDIVLRLPQNASVRTMEVHVPYMGFEISHPAEAFTFTEVVVTAGRHVVLQGLHASSIWVTTGLADIRGDVTAADIYLMARSGKIWSDITISEPMNGTSPSVTLLTSNAPIVATISSAKPGIYIKTMTTNGTVDVAYSL